MMCSVCVESTRCKLQAAAPRLLRRPIDNHKPPVTVLAFVVWGPTGWPVQQLGLQGPACHNFHVTNPGKNHIINVYTGIYLCYVTHIYTKYPLFVKAKLPGKGSSPSYDHSSLSPTLLTPRAKNVGLGGDFGFLAVSPQVT